MGWKSMKLNLMFICVFLQRNIEVKFSEIQCFALGGLPRLACRAGLCAILMELVSLLLFRFAVANASFAAFPAAFWSVVGDVTLHLCV